MLRDELVGGRALKSQVLAAVEILGWGADGLIVQAMQSRWISSKLAFYAGGRALITCQKNVEPDRGNVKVGRDPFSRQIAGVECGFRFVEHAIAFYQKLVCDEVAATCAIDSFITKEPTNERRTHQSVSYLCLTCVFLHLLWK